MPGPTERRADPAERIARACPGRRSRSGRGQACGPACLLYTPPRRALEGAHPRTMSAVAWHDGGMIDPSTETPHLDPDLVLWSTEPGARRPTAARAAPRLRRRRARSLRPRAVPARRRVRRSRPSALRSAPPWPVARLLVVPHRGSRRPRRDADDGCRIPPPALARCRRTRTARRRAARLLAGRGRRAAGDAARPRRASPSPSTSRATRRPATCPATPSSPSAARPSSGAAGRTTTSSPSSSSAHTIEWLPRARRPQRARLPGPDAQRVGAGARRRARRSSTSSSTADSRRQRERRSILSPSQDALRYAGPVLVPSVRKDVDGDRRDRAVTTR